MYIDVRFDDINPSTDFRKLENAIKKISKQINIALGVIPECLDKDLTNQKIYSNETIQEILNLSKLSNVFIFQHGTYHIVSEKNKGFIKSEFTLESYEKQKEIILRGLNILKNYEINPVGFMPPWHGYDLNTLNVARDLGFKYFFTTAEKPKVNGLNNYITRLNYARFFWIGYGLLEKNTFCYHLDEKKDPSLICKDIKILNETKKFFLNKNFKYLFSKFLITLIDFLKEEFFPKRSKDIFIKTLFKKFYNFAAFSNIKNSTNNKHKYTIIIHPNTFKISNKIKVRTRKIEEKSTSIECSPFFCGFFFCKGLKKKGYSRMRILFNLFFGKGYIKGYNLKKNRVIA